MSSVQRIVNPLASDSCFVAHVTKEMKQSTGMFQATQLSAKLVAGGAVAIAQGAVMSGAKFVGAGLLKLAELACGLIGGKCDFSKGEWTSHYTLAESRAEATKAAKTALLLTTAFVGPVKPQWVAGVSERLGLAAKEEGALCRFWNTVTENKAKIGLGLFAVGTASAVAYDVSQTGYIATTAKDLYEDFCKDSKKLHDLFEQFQELSKRFQNLEEKYKELQLNNEDLGKQLTACKNSSYFPNPFSGGS